MQIHSLNRRKCPMPLVYAGIARIHLAHAATWGASVNGSGGEMYRNYGAALAIAGDRPEAPAVARE